MRFLLFFLLFTSHMHASDSWQFTKWHDIQVPYPAWATVQSNGDTVVIQADNITFMLTENVVHLDSWLDQCGLYKLMPARKETERIPGKIIEANGYRENYLNHIRWFVIHGSIRSVSGIIFWRHLGNSRKLDTPIVQKWLDKCWEMFRPA